jgi:hypothetical protein
LGSCQNPAFEDNSTALKALKEVAVKYGIRPYQPFSKEENENGARHSSLQVKEVRPVYPIKIQF